MTTEVIADLKKRRDALGWNDYVGREEIDKEISDLLPEPSIPSRYSSAHADCEMLVDLIRLELSRQYDTGVLGWYAQADTYVAVDGNPDLEMIARAIVAAGFIIGP